MVGNVKHYLIIAERLGRVLPTDERAPLARLRRLVCECRGAVYGFATPGRDFIMSLQVG